MFEAIDTVTVSSGAKIKCYDLTFGLICDIESGKITETDMLVLEDATDLSADEIRALRKSDVDKLHSTIMKLTYPELYDEDGNLKSLPDVGDESDDKKKA